MLIAVPVFAHVGIEFACGGDLGSKKPCRQVGLTTKPQVGDD